MRWNLRRVLAVSFLVAVFWAAVSYLQLIEVPKSVINRGSKKYVVDIKNKIQELEERMDIQLKETNRLSERIHQHLKKQKTEHIIYNEHLKDDKDHVEAASTPVLPVLVIACDRITVRRCLENLIAFRPNADTFPIIVSQDCGHNATYEVIKSYVNSDPSISVVKQPDLSEIPLPRAKVKFKGYYKIARHFKFALNHVFETLGHEAVIIVEDDLDISSDFFEYFLGTYPLLLKDPSIWCISAWNDNGKTGLIESTRPEHLYRTDFFPGLGWMLRQETWMDFRPHWPQAFFDDWLRNPENTHNRACIRPEISRTYSFGKVGVSKGLFFDNHLRYIQLNKNFVEFTKLNLTYLLKENYDETLTSLVYSLPLMTADEVMSSGTSEETRVVRVPYSDAKTYQKAAKKLGLMDDFRSGIPRTAYRGIVTCYIKGRRVYLAPDYEWVKYDPNWG